MTCVLFLKPVELPGVKVYRGTSVSSACAAFESCIGLAFIVYGCALN